MDTEAIPYILGILEGSLPPKELERHTHGEVFTPLERVDEMLESLPAKVWSNPDLRWLDPAAGIGNFPLKAVLGGEGYPGLWRGLAKKLPNESERARHIVESMLFLVDINPRNNQTARSLLKRLFPTCTPNISSIDPKLGFLAEKPLFGHETFHIIMGNPPFQIGSVRAALVTNETRRRRKELGVGEGETNYWVRFVRKALAILEPNGFLVFIHPITWFKRDRLGAHDMILAHRLHAMKIFKNNGPGTAFGAHGRISVAWYVLEMQPASPEFPTRVLYGAEPGYEESLVLNTDSILILRYNSIYQKILRSGVGLLGDSGILFHATLRSCAEGGRHRLITDIHEEGSMEFVGSKVAHVHQGIPKLIVGGIHTPVVFFDKKGEYGLFSKGQRNYFVGSSEDLRLLAAFFRTRLATLLLDHIKFEQDFIRPQYFPDVRGIPGPINDETLADFFGFSADEKDIIAEHSLPHVLGEGDLHRRTCRSLQGVGHGGTRKIRS